MLMTLPLLKTLPSPSLQFSLPPSELISLPSSTKTYPKTPDKPTLSPEPLVTNTQLNLGELVELLLVFPEFQDLVPTELVKLLSVICVEKVECSLP
jgi:hypothetical protein